jgi:TolB-like protein/class 3 adenylate cyclase/Flp pilus assembly protein TadD
MERRLAAVMIADVAGYGRLSQADEEGTRARFQTDLHEVFEPRIAAHHGRLVKTMGDGLLVEFHSVVDALRCAVEVQRAEAERNAELPADRRMEFRIGVNLGDVIVEGDDIHGDGVIIAERLQQLADKGGITISAAAYEQVKHKPDAGFEFLGARPVKNSKEPVRVYRVLMDPAAAGKTIGEPSAGGWSWRWPAVAAAAVVVVLAAAAGAATWWRPWEPTIEPASIERMALPLPNKPSIAVLPFANMSGDPQQEYFADGMTDDLITELSKVSGLFVIARNSTFAYKGQVVPPKQVSEELGVRYLLEGSVQRAGDQLRINAQLIDALSGGHEWADKYDGSLSDVFSFQDKVATSIAESLAIRLTDQDKRSIAKQETGVPAAYDAFLRGWELYRRSTPDDYAAAIPYFEEAVRLDPEYGRAYAALALVYVQSQDLYWTASLEMSQGEAYRRAERYLEKAKKHPSSTSHYVTAMMSRVAADYTTSIAAFEEAIAFDPSDSWSYAQLGYTLNLANRPAEAIPFIDTAMRLDPRYPPQFLFFLGSTQFAMNRLEEAAENLERATQLNPDHDWSILLLAATYGRLGRKEDATSAIARYNDLKLRLGGIPLWIAELKRRTGSRYRWTLRMIAGLRLAGADETLPGSEFAMQNMLTASEVRTLLFGHRLRGRTPFSARELGASFTADGVVTLSGDWEPADGSPARFDGDQICFRRGFRFVEWCATLYRNPGGLAAKENEYIWYDEFGAFPFSIVE